MLIKLKCFFFMWQSLKLALFIKIKKKKKKSSLTCYRWCWISWFNLRTRVTNGLEMIDDIQMILNNVSPDSSFLMNRSIFKIKLKLYICPSIQIQILIIYVVQAISYYFCITSEPFIDHIKQHRNIPIPTYNRCFYDYLPSLQSTSGFIKLKLYQNNNRHQYSVSSYRIFYYVVYAHSIRFCMYRTTSIICRFDHHHLHRSYWVAYQSIYSTL